MAPSGMRDDVERWLVHRDLPFERVKSPGNSFHVLVRDAGRYGTPVEIFEPDAQPGVLVVGAKVTMKNSQTARYLAFGAEEKKQFEKKVEGFCSSIRAVSRSITEDGKQKIGVYVVLDDAGGAGQQAVFDAVDRVAEMHEKTARFLMKTF